MHRLDHEGRFFQVEGPLNAPRSKQGQPVIFQAGASEAGIELAGKYADAVFAHPSSIEGTITYTSRVKDAAMMHGRSRDSVKIFPGIDPIVGRTRGEAEAKYDAIRNLLSIDDALAYLGRFFDHHDFSQYNLDAKFPELVDVGTNSFRSTTDRIKAEAKRKQLSLREVALEVATPRPLFIGTAEEVATEIVRWFDAGACDGFMLNFSVQAEGLDDFTSMVVPELIKLGRYSRSLEGDTLRDHLGLPFKESRYAHQAVTTAARSNGVAGGV